MRDIKITLLVLILILTGCQKTKVSSSPSFTATTTPVPQTAIETLTPRPPEMPALEKNSIEFYRNGKTYEVVIGYDMGEAFFNATPQPAFPKKIDEIGEGHPGLLGYGDKDTLFMAVRD